MSVCNRQLARILSALLALSSCDSWEGYLRSQQVRTYTDLQTITAQIEELRRDSPSGQLAEAQLQAAIDSVNHGLDAWGNEFLYATDSQSAEFSYVVVSLGSDGELDVADIENYFSHPNEMIAGEYERDIVFRDGLPLLNAGK